MAHLIYLPTFCDERGCLSVLENQLPFEIKRFYSIYDVQAKRGGHRHKKTIQAFICVSGTCEIYIKSRLESQTVLLDKPNKCLIVEPSDWHTMDNFSTTSTLLVFASELYDADDYILEEP